MSQHDDRSASTDLPRTTGEFRAAPDISASTAEFKRFMGDQDQPERRGGAAAWPEQPWAGPASDRPRPSRRTWYLAGALVLLVLLIIILIAVG
jgi:hypothetical protein